MKLKISLLSRWWNTWKTLPVLSWIKAASLYRMGRFEAAKAYYLKGLEKHSEHPAHLCARLDLAYCLFRTGKFEESEEQLKYVLKRAPKSREAYLRLARIQLWTGRALDAAWTLRRALREVKPDADLVATFLIAVVEHGGPSFLLKEALEASLALPDVEQDDARIKAARARIALMKSGSAEARESLENTVSQGDVPIEAAILLVEVLLDEHRIAHARRCLRKAMLAAPEHPRVLSLFAQSYLTEGPFYNVDYAIQLATKACQATQWVSPREMHILAEAYYHAGDKMSALMAASKAKEQGRRLLGEYRASQNLDRLIESLSSGTLG